MPVIIMLVSGLLGWGLYWFFRLDGHEWLREVFNDKRRARRLMLAKESRERAAANTVAEPRDAALALLIKFGSVGGSLLPAAEAVITQAAHDTFGYGAELTEKLSYAGFVARNTPTFTVLFRELVPGLAAALSIAEREEFVGLLERVGGAVGGMTPEREEAIADVRVRLKLPARDAAR